MNDSVMIPVMALSGFLVTMNMWADKWSDVRFGLNDVYMVFMMIGWMYLFMGLYYNIKQYIISGTLIVVLFFVAIRKQWFISPNQFVRGMIPHHSMAILMAKRVLEKGNLDPELEKVARNVINDQEKEIKILKSVEK